MPPKKGTTYKNWGFITGIKGSSLSYKESLKVINAIKRIEFYGYREHCPDCQGSGNFRRTPYPCPCGLKKIEFHK